MTMALFPQPEPNTYNTLKIEFEETGQFSSLFLDYIGGSKRVQPYYHLFPSIENFEAQLKNRKFSDEKRKNLNLALKNQHEGFKTSAALEKNLSSLLDKNTF